jgi:HrpA-like RNA helicase
MSFRTLPDEERIVPDLSEESLRRRQKILKSRLNNESYLDLQQFRMNLPVHEYKNSIIECIKDNRVVIISG